nr:hypothetical protein [Tanacetum cinerariifolium]
MLLCKQEEAGIQLNAEQAPEQKVQNNDDYDVFAIDCQHSEQSESVHNTYLIEQDAQNVLIKSEDINYDSEQIEQNDEDVDLAKEQANNKLSEVNAHLYADYKKSKVELKRRNTVEYATEMELECAKLRGELLSNKMEHKSFVKPGYLKKAKQANPRLYDIGCYNDNLALMLSPDSDE